VRRRAALLLAPLLLAACASVPPAAPGPTLAGRMAVTVPAHAGQPARNATTQFELTGDATRGRLLLSSPLGTTLARASWQPGSAEVEAANGTRENFPSLDALAQRLLGEPLPLAALVDWLHGRPWPGAPSTASAGGFEQLGWRIDTSGYTDGLLHAERQTPAPAVSVRARIDNGS
jgi:outer membrane lipoprotein LolB